MTLVIASFIGVFSLFLVPYLSYSQQAEAPKYKDGDWWRVKAEVAHSGIQRSGLCEENYAEYLVKIEGGKPKVFGVSGSGQEEIICPPIESQLLDSGPEEREFLKFPLRAGNKWSVRYLRPSPGGRRGSWASAESTVLGTEKIKMPKGELETFKIERRIEGEPTETYFYSPAVKAIILFDRKTPRVQRKVTLIDFQVSQ